MVRHIFYSYIWCVVNVKHYGFLVNFEKYIFLLDLLTDWEKLRYILGGLGGLWQELSIPSNINFSTIWRFFLLTVWGTLTGQIRARIAIFFKRKHMPSRGALTLSIRAQVFLLYFYGNVLTVSSPGGDCPSRPQGFWWRICKSCGCCETEIRASCWWSAEGPAEKSFLFISVLRIRGLSDFYIFAGVINSLGFSDVMSLRVQEIILAIVHNRFLAIAHNLLKRHKSPTVH